MVHRVRVEAEPLRGLEQRPDRLASVLQVLGLFVESDVGTRYLLPWLVYGRRRALELLQRPHDLQEVEVGPVLLLRVLLHGLAHDFGLRGFRSTFTGDHHEIPAMCAIRSGDRRSRSLIVALKAR